MSRNNGMRDWVVLSGAAIAVGFVLFDSCQKQRSIPETIEVTVPIDLEPIEPAGKLPGEKPTRPGPCGSVG